MRTLHIISLSICLFFSVTSLWSEEAPKENDALSRKEMVSSKFQKVRSEISGDVGSASNALQQRNKQTPPSSAPDSLFKMTFQMVSGLIFILILAIFSIRLLKKFQKSSLVTSRKSSTDLLEVLETCYLGNDQKVVVMRVDRGTSVFGVTPHGITLLKDLEMMVPLSSSKGTFPREKEEGALAFSDNLNQFLSKFKRPKTVSETLKEV